MNDKAIRAELIHWLAKYDSKLRNGSPPTISDTIDEILAIVEANNKQVKGDVDK